MSIAPLENDDTKSALRATIWGGNSDPFVPGIGAYPLVAATPEEPSARAGVAVDIGRGAIGSDILFGALASIDRSIAKATALPIWREAKSSHSDASEYRSGQT